MPEDEQPPKRDVSEKPPLHHPVRCFVADGTTVVAVWNGALWWGEGKEVQPVQWQEMVLRRFTP